MEREQACGCQGRGWDGDWGERWNGKLGFADVSYHAQNRRRRPNCRAQGILFNVLRQTVTETNGKHAHA